MADSATLLLSIIPLVGLTMSVTVSVATYVVNRRTTRETMRLLRDKASIDQMNSVEQQLRQEIAQLRLALQQCAQEREALQRENLALLRDLQGGRRRP